MQIEHHSHMTKPTFDKSRPLSWSAISSFEYDKEQWYRKYVLGERDEENAEMRFGKKIGERWASDPTYLPSVSRLNVFEHPFKVMFGKIPMIGFADNFCTETNARLKELKTGVKAWDQKRANEHGQIDMYLLMNYITNKVDPSTVECELVWLPTKRKESGDFKVEIDFRDDPVVPQVFRTKRTMAQILAFGARINRVYGEMEAYAQAHS